MAVATESAATRAQPAWRQRVGAFWRWWLTELALLMPEALSAAGRFSRLPLLAVEGDDVVLVESAAAPPGPGTRVSTEALDTARARTAVQAMLEKAGETRSRARLALARGETLVRRVTMPAATEENLDQVLGFEMDRLTPFGSGDVYFDHRVLSRDAGSGTLVALLAVARREIVDPRLEKLRSLGVSVQGVGLREEPAHPGSPLDLLPSEQRGERESRPERMLRRAAAGAVVALVVAVLAVPIWKKRDMVIELQPLVAKARAEAEATDAIARDLEKQVADYNFLLAKKYASYPVLAYIEEVSRILPDHTWVQELQLKNTGKSRELTIQGETNSASKLIETMEQSTLLQNATPRGTVTRGSQPGLERFMITAEAKPRSLPDSQPLGEGAPATVPPGTAPATSQPAAPAKTAPASAPAPAKTPPAPTAATVTPVPQPPAASKTAPK